VAVQVTQAARGHALATGLRPLGRRAPVHDLSRGLMRRPPDVAVARIDTVLQQLRQSPRELST